jgi:hypothetical protein
MKKGVGSGFGSGTGSGSLSQRRDPGIRIRTKMSRIPNTDINTTHEQCAILEVLNTFFAVDQAEAQISELESLFFVPVQYVCTNYVVQ